jgi:hypothetical protein
LIPSTRRIATKSRRLGEAGTDHLGLLWYAKPVLTRKTPLELPSYAECDQFSHAAQFKAYRDLGRCIGDDLVRARSAPPQALVRNTSHEQSLAAANCEDAHWAVVLIAQLHPTNNAKPFANWP